MLAGDVKLGSIFFDNHRYEIPMFQRPYVWGEELNWAPLWEDVSDAADGVIADMLNDEWPEEPPTYFLGPIVVKATPQAPTTARGFDVGRWRIATDHPAGDAGSCTTCGQGTGCRECCRTF